ncbi:hypothetical protein [Ruminococcus sp.]|uniref:hypothetical protein n=1 Tax=Ruminococcus sp. TaxID=41978 RepID=UPI0025EE5840|nr:hypothetical protein [Ruminococcus sp.]MBQ8967290.1 hypothetical protein [Ruminococcus sp.]
MAKKITYEDFIAIDKKIDVINDEISELIQQGASDEVLEEKYIQLGKAVIGRDLAEARLKEDMTEEEKADFDKLISLYQRQKMLELRLSIMEKELDETMASKAQLDETIADGERVLELVEKTIRAVENQSSAVN